MISFIKRGDLVATKPPGMRGYRIPRQAFEEYLAAGYQAVQDEVQGRGVLTTTMTRPRASQRGLVRRRSPAGRPT